MTMQEYVAAQYPLLGGLGLWEWLLGKPQSWYDTLNAVQKDVGVVLAKVQAVDDGVWGTIWQKKDGENRFASRQATIDALTSAFSAIVVTSDHEPSDGELAVAQSLVTTIQGMIDYVQSVAPEIASSIMAEGAKVSAELDRTKLVSPAIAGKQAFLDSLNNQLRLLPTNWTTYALLAAAGLAALFIVTRK
jgi:hypothetical protein